MLEGVHIVCSHGPESVKAPRRTEEADRYAHLQAGTFGALTGRREFSTFRWRCRSAHIHSYRSVLSHVPEVTSTLVHWTVGPNAAEDNAKPTQANCSSEPTISIRDRTLGGVRRASASLRWGLASATRGLRKPSSRSRPCDTMGSLNVALCGLFLSVHQAPAWPLPHKDFVPAARAHWTGCHGFRRSPADRQSFLCAHVAPAPCYGILLHPARGRAVYGPSSILYTPRRLRCGLPVV